jgi:chromate reductase
MDRRSMGCGAMKGCAMSSMQDVAVFVGRLRKESLNRKMALALADIAPGQIQLQIVEIGALPLYNEDFDIGTPPSAWVELRRRVSSADAVLFVTPEYNRSVPGVLKNALDVASRPYGQNSWNGKPGAVVTVSSGAIGGFGSNHHLRQSLMKQLLLRSRVAPRQHPVGVRSDGASSKMRRFEHNTVRIRSWGACWAWRRASGYLPSGTASEPASATAGCCRG